MTVQQTAVKVENNVEEKFTYLKDRLETQQKWHDHKSIWNRKRFYAIEIVTLSAGAFIPVINVLTIIPNDLIRIISALLGTVIAVAVGIGKLYKFQENWLSYRTLAEALKREQEFFVHGVGDYDVSEDEERNKILVEHVENMIANTTSQYVTLHMAERERQSELSGAGQSFKPSANPNQSIEKKT